MADFIDLGMRLDTRQLDAAKKSVTGFGDIVSVTQAKTARSMVMMEKGFSGVAAAATQASGTRGAGGMTSALGQLGNMSSATRFKVQNLGFQLQDMAVQFQAGTRASVVFAQQGSQILSIFGPVGAILGTLAAVSIPLLAAAFSFAGSEARTLDDVMGDLQATISDLEAAQNILEMSVDELGAKYGEMATEVRDAALALAEFSIASAQNQLAETVLEWDRSLKEFMMTSNTAFSSGTMLATAIRNISEEFGVSGTVAREMESALRAARDAMSFEDRAAALREFRRLMEENNVEASKLPPELLAALQATASLTVQMGELAGQTTATANAARQVRAAMAGGPMNFGTPLYRQGAAMGDLLPPTPTKPITPKVAGGGGGMSEAERERQRMQQEAKRLFEATRTEAEKYAAELENIEKLHSGGFINADTYGRALEQLKEKYNGASDAAKFFQQQASRAADELVDLAIDGGSLIDIMDQVGRTIAKAALQAALFGQGPMAGLFGQTPGVGLLSNIFKFATGTNNAPGGMALVGEQGPELVNLPRGASVTPADRMKGELRQMRPQAAAPQVNTKIVNVLDPGLVGEYLSTAQGEQLIMNVVNRNQGDR